MKSEELVLGYRHQVGHLTSDQQQMPCCAMAWTICLALANRGLAQASLLCRAHVEFVFILLILFFFVFCRFIY